MPWSSSTSSVGRHSGVPLETRGAIARYDAARDVLELHGTAKKQHWNRDEIARMLGRPPLSVHLFEGHVGGGFGVRGELYPEDLLVCAAALRLRRPVKWIEDRREHLDRDQPFPPAAPPHPRRRRCRGPPARHRRRVLPRPGRLCPHPRRARRRPRRRHAARPLSPAGLPRRRPFPPDQQDPGRHLPRARPLRDHLRARTADGRHRRPPRSRPDRAAPPQPGQRRRNAACPPARRARHRHRARFRRLSRPARPGARALRLAQAAAGAGGTARAGRMRRRRPRLLRREERPRPLRRRARDG